MNNRQEEMQSSGLSQQAAIEKALQGSLGSPEDNAPTESQIQLVRDPRIKKLKQLMNTTMYRKFVGANVEGWAGRQTEVDQGPRRRLSQEFVPITIYTNASTRRRSEMNDETLTGEEGPKLWNNMVSIANKNRFAKHPTLLHDRRSINMSGSAKQESGTQQGLRQKSKENFKKARKKRRLDTVMF